MCSFGYAAYKKPEKQPICHTHKRLNGMSDPIKTLSLPWVQPFLTAQPALNARLATCNPHTLQPHVVPVWYDWDGERLWISAFQSTRKLREVMKNPLISVVVDTDAPGQPARGVILEGRAALISDPAQVLPTATRIYTRYLGSQGVLAPDPQSWLKDPENRLIVLAPQRVYAW